MKASTFRNIAAKFLAPVALAMSVGATSAVAADPVKITVANFADVQAVANVAKYVLETKLNIPVQFVNADLGVQYQGLARNDVDIMVGGWMPITHHNYYEKYKDNLDDVRVIYTGGKIGWAVPDYVPASELDSFADLNKPDVKSKLHSTITGVEPGTGEMQTSEKAMKAYNLDGYNLQSSSEAGMLASLQRAYASKQWIVATVFSPHWLFQKYKMRYLKDPKGAMGGDEQIHAFASKQFASKNPRAYAFFKHYDINLQEVEAVQFDGVNSNNFPAAAKKWVDAHPDRVKAWLAQ
ncbi:substrate-binding region of ABC-type glycine betaine transport system [Caballeronia calidae]|uniref:Substrate-binding region of ABC-type glycine betaine transport system n=1 Tax=Caballeronia calidae TaxID=1777139 RepID=A0A158B8P6_9BURK|nr:glycine betaine ABC transporter substrate-binding protein [Caballeronia calidae]SAK66452.1 substrate-binding region of ABC-type glycine betaine transport system [Caballeronia calidae]